MQSLLDADYDNRLLLPIFPTPPLDGSGICKNSSTTDDTLFLRHFFGSYCTAGWKTK